MEGGQGDDRPVVGTCSMSIGIINTAKEGRLQAPGIMDNLRIRKYMDQLFENGPINRRTLELKEELIANALEKYNDLTLRGYNEDEAFQQVVSSIGNVEQLFAEMGPDEDYSQAYYLQWAREAQEKESGADRSIRRTFPAGRRSVHILSPAALV